MGSCLLLLSIMSSFKLLLAVFGVFLLVLPNCLGGVTTSRVLGQGVPFKKTIGRGVASSRTTGQNTWTAEDEAKAQLRKSTYQEPPYTSLYGKPLPSIPQDKRPGAYYRDQSSQGSTYKRDQLNQGISTSGSTYKRDQQNQGSTYQRDHQGV